jgi:hypothetical protein
MFDADEVVARSLDRTDQFVELGLDRGAVAVLGILDQEASRRVVATKPFFGLAQKTAASRRMRVR